MRELDLDNVQEFKPFTNPTGLLVLGAVNVEDVPEKEYLKITYDIAEGEMKNYYSIRKKDRDFSLPFLIRSYKESALPFFKGYVTSLEKSNKNYKFSSNEKDMVGKIFGAVIAEEEYTKNNGSIGVRPYIHAIHSVDAIKKGVDSDGNKIEVPELKKLNGGNAQATNNSSPFAGVATSADAIFGEPTVEAPTYEPAPIDNGDVVPF